VPHQGGSRQAGIYYFASIDPESAVFRGLRRGGRPGSARARQHDPGDLGTNKSVTVWCDIRNRIGPARGGLAGSLATGLTTGLTGGLAQRAPRPEAAVMRNRQFGRLGTRHLAAFPPCTECLRNDDDRERH
jgi:hypothetical protein